MRIAPRPVSDTEFWDARTARLIRFLTHRRTFPELWVWAKGWRVSGDLTDMLAYLDIMGRARGDNEGWIRFDNTDKGNNT